MTDINRSIVNPPEKVDFPAMEVIDTERGTAEPVIEPESDVATAVLVSVPAEPAVASVTAADGSTE